MAITFAAAHAAQDLIDDDGNINSRSIAAVDVFSAATSTQTPSCTTTIPGQFASYPLGPTSTSFTASETVCMTVNCGGCMPTWSFAQMGATSIMYTTTVQANATTTLTELVCFQTPSSSLSSSSSSEESDDENHEELSYELR
ncbi:MAG: hypothetical protein M1825_002752 [Sarcosagium campestre]|nr:MAG: hypothetical protein M1825_002752 [Sarcosagium campestre]